MFLQQNISLRKYNTFKIGASARYFAAFTNTQELLDALSLAGSIHDVKRPPVILGGGSNILFTGDYDGLILKNEIKGINKVEEDDQNVFVRVGAGENWHQFVMYCLDNNFAGIENLSLIPGNTGASPMQNIGAYGVEVKDVFHELETLHLQEKKIIKFTAADCKFGYRESVFKNKFKDRFAILNVTFRLSKEPAFNISYGAIKEELERMRIRDLSIRAISQAVINIRSSKLPDPAVIGNAGSFFKNPQIRADVFDRLKKEFPGIIGFNTDDGSVKMAAGWMIEQCGWKGFRQGDAGCYQKQALVLVNFGNAGGQEIYALGERIAESVKKKFGVDLEREVNIF